MRLDSYDFQAVSNAMGLMALLQSVASYGEAVTMHASEPIRARVLAACERPAADLARAHHALFVYGQALRHALAPYDALILPMAKQTAWPCGTQPAGIGILTNPANAAGLPATVFPAGLSAAGLPIALQVVAHSDSAAFALARYLAIEVGAPPAFL